MLRRLALSVTLLAFSTEAWPQAAQPVAPVVNNAVVSSGNPLPTLPNISGGEISILNPVPVSPIIGGATVSAANPFATAPTVAGAAVSTSNPLPSTVLLGGVLVSTANPFPISPIIAGAAASSTNPVPVAGNIGTRMYVATAVNNSFPSGGDVFCLTGSASKTVKLRRLLISGASSNSTVIDVQLILRSTLNTGGTSSLPTIVAFDSNNPLATAVAVAYTTPPTLGTTVGVAAVAKYTVLSTTSPQTSVGLLPLSLSEMYDQFPTLNGASQEVCINVGAVTGAVWSISVWWSEE